jgi:hypothetical protein
MNNKTIKNDGKKKKFQDNKNKEYEKAQKQINELTGVLNKHKRIYLEQHK